MSKRNTLTHDELRVVAQALATLAAVHLEQARAMETTDPQWFRNQTQLLRYKAADLLRIECKLADKLNGGNDETLTN